MAVALGTVFMLLSSAIPFFEYAVPAAAGFIVLFVESEVGKTWSFGTYVATSILGVFLVPNKEAVGIYIALFGLYPVINCLKLQAILQSVFILLPPFFLHILL